MTHRERTHERDDAAGRRTRYSLEGAALVALALILTACQYEAGGDGCACSFVPGAEEGLFGPYLVEPNVDGRSVEVDRVTTSTERFYVAWVKRVDTGDHLDFRLFAQDLGPWLSGPRQVLAVELPVDQRTHAGTFFVDAPALGWLPGLYRVVFLCNGETVAELDVPVEGELAVGVTGPHTQIPDTFAPEQPVSLITPTTPRIFALWRHWFLQPGDPISLRIIATDVHGQLSGQVLQEERVPVEQAGAASGWAAFDMPAGGWPAGLYTIEYRFGDTLVDSVTFEVPLAAIRSMPTPRP